MNGINTNGMYNNNFIFAKKEVNIASNIKNLADKKDDTETFYKENKETPTKEQEDWFKKLVEENSLQPKIFLKKEVVAEKRFLKNYETKNDFQLSIQEEVKSPQEEIKEKFSEFRTMINNSFESISKQLDKIDKDLDESETGLEFWHNADVKYARRVSEEEQKEFEQFIGDASVSKRLDKIEDEIKRLDWLSFTLPEDKQKEIEKFKEKLQAKRDKLRDLHIRQDIYMMEYFKDSEGNGVINTTLKNISNKLENIEKSLDDVEDSLEFWHNADVKYISKKGEFGKEFNEAFGNISISKKIDELEKEIEHLDNFDIKLPEDKQKEIENFKEKLQEKRDRLKELISRAEIYEKDADNYHD